MVKIKQYNKNDINALKMTLVSKVSMVSTVSRYPQYGLNEGILVF
jgi:hypothetical protein